MQKVYLLLRSNKQTGPYTLEELLQFDLKPFDLVWVEGRSAAWQYPFEIPALKPYVAETPQAELPFQPIATSAMEEKIELQKAVPKKGETPKRVFVSIPNTYKPVEEPIREKPSFYKSNDSYVPSSTHTETEAKAKPTMASYSPASGLRQDPAEVEAHTNYARSLNDAEEAYTSWIYQQKTKKRPKVNVNELVLAGLILAVIAGSYFVMSKPSVANSVLPANKISAKPANVIIENNPDAISQIQEPVFEPQQTVSGAAPAADQTKNTLKKNPPSVPKDQTNSVPAQNSIPDEKTANIPDEKKDIVLNVPDDEKQTTTTNIPEKKKKLGEVFKEIFSKKEKVEEKNDKGVMGENPKPSGNREATKRDGDNRGNGTTEIEDDGDVVALAGQIDLSSNVSDNWMLGIKNLKITLRNRSNRTLQAASVTVNYYDEHNQLLQKKLLYFNNVAPKSRTAVAAPDHKWADHVDFELTSVTARADQYASN